MITVYHNDHFIEYMMKGAPALKGTIVHQTAKVNTDSLDKAFELTNHITIDWQQNPEVTLLAPGLPRSTSVGDLLKKDATYYVVEPLGFRVVSREEECEIIFHIV